MTPLRDQPFDLVNVKYTEETYASSEHRFCVVLMALGFPPVRVHVEDGRLTYYFELDKVSEFVGKLIRGEDFQVSVIKFFYALETWNSNLSAARRGPQGAHAK